MMNPISRRDLLTLLGSAAAAWPLGARAQQTAMPVIGYLNASSREGTVDLEPFLQGLKETGFMDGQNVHIEYRWAEGRFDRLLALARELVDLRAAVICAAGGSLPALAAKSATPTIPIVFQGGGDPVSLGLVASLNRPGGNVTGAMNLSGGPVEGKAVQYLRELVPTAATLGLLVNPSARILNAPDPGTDAKAAARDLGWDFLVFEASTDDELQAAFEAMACRKVGALNVTGNPFFASRRARIVALAAQYSIPASFGLRDFVLAGGLMSYGTDLRETNRVAGNYVGRILKGEKPADLPVQQAVKVELAINLKTAKALGLTFPITLFGRADEVIE
jgi:putative tryptophan/tyrosine transport system substrate-binding protein